VTLLGVFYDPSAGPLASSRDASAATVAAVPEPATLVLAALASLFVIAASRRASTAAIARMIPQHSTASALAHQAVR
jgi:hypothetical protein